MSSLHSNSLQSPRLNPTELLWDVVEREIRIIDVQLTNLQQLRDAIASIWTKIPEERRMKAVLKAKEVQPFTSRVYLIKWPVRKGCVVFKAHRLSRQVL